MMFLMGPPRIEYLQSKNFENSQNVISLIIQGSAAPDDGGLKSIESIHNIMWTLICLFKGGPLPPAALNNKLLKLKQFNFLSHSLCLVGFEWSIERIFFHKYLYYMHRRQSRVWTR